MNVIVRPAAAADIEDAHRWYRDKRSQLGAEFLLELRSAMTRVLDHPASFAVVHRETRRIRLRRFPYGLSYRIYDDTIVVVACMHGKRDPRMWKSRA